MKHVERSAGKIVGVYENPQYRCDGSLRTEPVADTSAEVAEFFTEVNKRYAAQRRTPVVTPQPQGDKG